MTKHNLYVAFCHKTQACFVEINSINIFLTFYVFGSCFKTLEVVLVSDFLLFFFQAANQTRNYASPPFPHTTHPIDKIEQLSRNALTYTTKHKELLNTSAFDKESSSGVRRQIYRKCLCLTDPCFVIYVSTFLQSCSILSASPAVGHSLPSTVSKTTQTKPHLLPSPFP